MQYIGITLVGIHLSALVSKKRVSKLLGVVLKKPKAAQIAHVANLPLWESGSCLLKTLS